ncbi:uncharacterized protein LOC129685779 isoform X2 [Psammomys obesus]|uniref:uncharacterized protein LOC129685779 isoform X2 n=1 Tax=Psammomys obesus TaxID=48139 RepID=UPI00245293EB|nr:uncharacterized protein LOC129685779 isoform X2 [Psammomys obesus]
MDKPATAALSRPQNLSLLVLLSYLMTTLSAEAVAVCYGFTVSRSGSGQWSYKFQDLLNERSLKCHATDDLRNRLNQTLNGEVYLFQEVLNQVRQENKITKEPLTLQVKICCWNEGDGSFNRSWDLSPIGPKTFHIDSNTKNGPEVDSASNLTEEMREKIKKVKDFLNMASQGECRSWVRETKLHCEENLEHTGSTSKAQNNTQVITATAPSTTTPIQNTANTKISLGAVVAPLTIGIGVIAVIAVIAVIRKKCFYQRKKELTGVSPGPGSFPMLPLSHESNGNSVPTAASWTSLEQYPSLLPHSQKRKPSDGVGDL